MEIIWKEIHAELTKISPEIGASLTMEPPQKSPEILIKKRLDAKLNDSFYFEKTINPI